MSSLNASGHDENPDETRGPNLKLMYGFILLAMLLAIAAAAFIVLPFYHRH